ncbi:MAG: (Fe-S)-binding protein [Nitrosomonas sp.]|nr:(Fe-S)-binding protein [Nitrosomonas sp.]
MDSTDHLQKDSLNFLLTEANRCVSCGLCLPHCPTYHLTMSEADSPRGRIALMNGVASGYIPLNEKFVQHMDRCLTCRACENVCPNNVAYGQLIDAARAMIVVTPSNLSKGGHVTKKSWMRVFLENELIAKPARLDYLRKFFHLCQSIGLQQWLQNTSLLEKTNISTLAEQMPPIERPCFSATDDKKSSDGWQEIYPATGKQRGEVGLFLGCVARLADVLTLNSAIYVLNRLGYTVHVPSAQTCCGALHRHGGDSAVGARLAQQNKEAFEALNLHTIITTASGCGVQLSEYGFRQNNSHIKSESACDKDLEFSSCIIDISKFLATAEGWDDVEITPLRSQIAVHDPCSLCNVLHDQSYPYTLLAHIPSLQVVALAGNNQCCGAAGTYFLDQPKMAEKLQADKMSAIANCGVQYVVTSNIGCSLYMASGLRAAESEVEVMHPVTLLARQMGIQ